MSEGKDTPDEINAAPTKAFFVEMLVRDIPLEQAVLDLVDNSIDGAKRLSKRNFNNRYVKIVLSTQQFRIWDNCGGFDRKTARDYAFRFGRPADAPITANSIGQFGVGMKRALFKFGRHFTVRSATSKEEWAIDVPVDKWERIPDDWHFHWAEFGDETEISTNDPGTDIVVDKLRAEVASRFGSQLFINAVSGFVKSKHRQFIAEGMSITINGVHLDATNLLLLQSPKIKAGVDILTFGSGRRTLTARIVAGIGESSPKEAGWYVICNGRIILEADRRRETGWGQLEEENKAVLIPSYHNQFARFRGVVFFEARDSANLPWNTTKTDVDQDHPSWQKTFERMKEMMRPVINALNELDADIDANSRDESPLLDMVRRATEVKADNLLKKANFRFPERGSVKKGLAEERISYTKPRKDVVFLQDALGLNNPKAVGEKTFDLILSRHKK